MSGVVTLIARRGGWCAVHKPAGMPSEPAPGFDVDVRSAAARELGALAADVHVVNRLDVGVSGVVLLAVSAEARSEAGELLARHAIERRYVAILSMQPQPPASHWTWPLGRVRGRRGAGGSESEKAITAYASVAVAPGGAALVVCEPLTGRTHQIRAHASTAGVPVLFDRRYGGRGHAVCPDGRVLELDRLALHAARMTVPLAEAPWVVLSHPQRELGPVWVALGGRDEDLAAALELEVPAWNGPTL